MRSQFLVQGADRVYSFERGILELSVDLLATLAKYPKGIAKYRLIEYSGLWRPRAEAIITRLNERGFVSNAENKIIITGKGSFFLLKVQGVLAAVS